MTKIEKPRRAAPVELRDILQKRRWRRGEP
jgi:hypothetical protein